MSDIQSSDQHYDVLVNGQTRRLHLVDTQRVREQPRDLVEPIPRRSAGMRAVDCLAVFAILLLPISLLYSTACFVVLLALVLSLVLTAYWSLVVWLLTALGPPDTPRVIAVIKAPDRLYCPRCGEDKTDKYCSACGVNVEKEYRRMVRQLATYIVQDTEQQRESLTLLLRQHIHKVADQQKKQIQAEMAAMERQYVMEVVRLQKAIKQERASLPPPPDRSMSGEPGEGIATCTFR